MTYRVYIYDKDGNIEKIVDKNYKWDAFMVSDDAELLGKTTKIVQLEEGQEEK